MRLTHRARLTFTAAAATGALLAVVFVAIVLMARQSDLSRKRDNLRSAMNALAGDPEQLELAEFRESHPEMSMTAYDRSGHATVATGAIRLPSQLGFHNRDGVLSLGRRRYESTVVVGTDWSDSEGSLARLSLWLGLLWLPLTCLCGAVTWLAARAMFKPLERLSVQADEIGKATLTDRLQTEDQAEFGAFAAQLNRMLDRIQESVEREERFASDAAHELRTPLAILRVQLESTLMRERSAAEYAATQRAALAELERMSRLVESLLQSTRPVTAESGFSLVADVMLQAAARWQDRYVAAGVTIASEPVDVAAQIGEDELAIVLDNLLDNALRFSPAGSTVRLWAKSHRETIEVGVSDEGPGIDPKIGDRVFDRFVRAEDDRNRTSGGAGIGLSVCRRIVEARGGRIERRRVEYGANVVCTLRRIES